MRCATSAFISSIPASVQGKCPFQEEEPRLAGPTEARQAGLLIMAARRELPEEQYTASDIQVLEGLEAVRRRPGMYIGGTDQRGLNHLVVEVIDNSIDEAMAGFCDRIWIHVSSEGRVTVRDNGRGIPLDTHARTGKSALETV